MTDSTKANGTHLGNNPLRAAPRACDGRVGDLADGRRALTRRAQRDGRATLEIQEADGRVTDRFRYGE